MKTLKIYSCCLWVELKYVKATEPLWGEFTFYHSPQEFLVII